jgi:predicted glycosyltransferase
MKVLFCLLHFGYERNFEPVIRELAARGHDVHIAAERSDRDPAKAVVESIASQH